MVAERAAEANRIAKVLEGGNIKLASVVTDILGVSSRDMLAALASGVEDPGVSLSRLCGQPKVGMLNRWGEGPHARGRSCASAGARRHLLRTGSEVLRLLATFSTTAGIPASSDHFRHIHQVLRLNTVKAGHPQRTTTRKRKRDKGFPSSRSGSAPRHGGRCYARS